MNQLNKKQKIILIAILITSIIFYLVYNYINDKSYVYTEENTSNSVENTTEENVVEKTSDKIVVHISGAVNKEGIVELDEGSRVSDAIDMAEGLKENADTSKINLAYKLEDGMKVYIPTIGETEEEINSTDLTETYVSSSSGVTKSDTSSSTTSKININTASQSELETLPGIGEATAIKIINYRESNGKFSSIEEIKNVNGIGDAKYENIKDLICV